jgi:hypothetical protein
LFVQRNFRGQRFRVGELLFAEGFCSYAALFFGFGCCEVERLVAIPRKRREGRVRGGKGRRVYNVQNKSPSTDPASAAPSAPPFPFFRIPHSQAGYSPSSKATGSFFPFTKFKPLSVVPAATELLTVGAAFSALLGAWREEAEGEALKGVEKGCAAPVDVAAGGVCEEEVGLPVRGEAVERREGVVVMARRKRRVVGRWMAVRRQRVQIIVCGCGVESDLDFEVLLCACDWDKDSRWR